jgi:hypothetical protein
VNSEGYTHSLLEMLVNSQAEKDKKRLQDSKEKAAAGRLKSYAKIFAAAWY